MGSKYEDSARKLAQQPKVRMRVINRRKLATTITATVLIIAMSVGMTFLFERAYKIEEAERIKSTEQFLAENYVPKIDYDAAAAEQKEYIESHYSAGTIDELKSTVIHEYGVLIDAITETEKLGENANAEQLDDNRLDKAIAGYVGFKEECEKDNIDYNTVSEADRVKKAGSLYNIEYGVLDAQLGEALQKIYFFAPGSLEYEQNEQTIADLKHKMNSLRNAMEVVGEKNMTLYFDNINMEDGKQK